MKSTKRAVRKSAIPMPASPAMKRAARKAREIARRYGTPIYVSRNGKVVALRP